MKVRVADIARKYGLEVVGNAEVVDHIALPGMEAPTSLLWTKSLEIHQSVKAGVLITDQAFQESLSENITYLFCKKSPRLIFAKVMNDFFDHLIPDDFSNHVADHLKRTDIKIGDHCFIAENVKIGSGTVIYPNSSIFAGTKIGTNCMIGANCSISTVGLGFEYDGDEIIKFPQIGGVVIGDNVELGPGSTIRRGALGNTSVGDDTKIGSLSNIGHNSKVGKQSILTTQCVVGGSATVGDRVFMGINSIVRNKVTIGHDVNIGMGSVVASPIPDGVVAYGVPAKVARKNTK